MVKTTVYLTPYGLQFSKLFLKVGFWACLYTSTASIFRNLKRLHFFRRKISSAACGFSSIKIHYSVTRINEVYVFFNKIEKT